MGLIKTIIAFFNYKGRQMEMEVDSANIKNGVAHLRPKGEKNKIFAIESDVIRIMIDNNESDHIDIIEKTDEEDDKEKSESPKNDVDPNDKNGTGTRNHKEKQKKRKAVDSDFMFLTKKSFSLKFYEDEKQEIVAACKNAGAKRDEYFLACARVASQKKVEAELKRIRKKREQNLAEYENQLHKMEKDSGMF